MRAPRSAVWTGVLMGVGAVAVAWFVAPLVSGKGGVEVVGPLERSVEVSTSGGGTRHVTLWLRAELRESAVFEVYREEARALVKLGGDVAGLDIASVNREVDRMRREEEVTSPSLTRVVVPRLDPNGSEGRTRVVRWRQSGLWQNAGALGATGLGFGMLGFGIVAIVARVNER